jgi:hypothetical protein
MPMHKAIEVSQNIYRETQAFYAELAPDHGNLGFQILYGPPVISPPILFIGYQPGGGLADFEMELANGVQDGWPNVCEYATAQWRLAKYMQNMFGTETLKKCVGLNAIFIRSPTVERFRKTVGAKTRKMISDFCLPRAEQIIQAVQPQRIVSIGFETLSLFGNTVPDIKNEKGRTLTRTGQIVGERAIATLHLSGAQISTADRERIRDRVLAI